MKTSVLAGLSETDQNSLFQDETYGFATPQALYQWALALNGGAESTTYKDILSYFSGKITNFDDSKMQQIVGPKSLMFQLNQTFGFNVGYVMDYDSNIATPE